MEQGCRFNLSDSKGDCIMSPGIKCADIKCSTDFGAVSEDTVVVKKDNFGLISFGQYAGQKWEKLPEKYLQYLMSKDCHTSTSNKDMAYKVLSQRRVADGQLEIKSLRK